MSARAIRRAREREARREEKRRARLARRGVLGTVALGAGVVFAPATAHAASYEVNSLNDPGDGTCNASECTLREAVTAANNNAGHDDVTFQSGLSGTIRLYNGEIPITEDISIQGPGANQITVDARGASRIFNADMPGANYGQPVDISGLTLTGGFISTPFVAAGGAVYSDHADLSISDADIRDNHVFGKYFAVGGGVDAVNGDLTVTDSTVADNTAYARNDSDQAEFSFAIAQGGGIASKYTRSDGGSNTPTLTVTGSTVRNNEAQANVGDATENTGLSFGGGTFSKYSDTDISDSDTSDSNIRQNTSHGDTFAEGGGVSNKYGFDLAVTDSTLRQNLATSGDPEADFASSVGGGISSKYRNFITAESAQRGITLGEPEVTISGSTLEANVSEGDGGGVSTSGPALHVDTSDFKDNLATRAGGGADVGSTPGFTDPEVTFTDSTFTGNGAGKYGGSISLDGPDGESLIQRSTLSSGYADDDGGGLFIGNTTPSTGIDGLRGGTGPTAVTVDRSTIDTNTAGDDGGGVAIDDPEGEVLVSDSTISGNAADHTGGGINSYNRNDVPVSVQNSTVADNTAVGTEGGGPTAGGGIYRAGYDDSDYVGDDSILLSSTIVADNSEADLGEGGDASGAFNTRFSLVEDTDSATVNDLGGNIFDTDPQLGSLQDNGGPTETQQQSASSPVIDAGDSNGLSVDQRGEDRTVDQPSKPNAVDGTDMGAVELSSLEVVPGSCHQANANEIIGTTGDDDLTGTTGPDAILALDGNDIVHGRSGNDCLFGQPGRDQLFGADGADLMDGGPTGDLLDGGPGVDTGKGGGGADTVKGRAGNDHLTGGGDRDTLRGNAGKDSLSGGARNDTLAGDTGNDVLRGGPGDDTLRGGKGKDTLKCGSGNDTAVVGPGDHVSSNCEHVIGHT